MKTKTSGVVTGGATKKAPVSRNGIVPAVVTSKGRGPSELWKDVKKDEIGTGFEIVEGVFEDEKPAPRKKRVRRFTADFERERIFANKFIHIKGEGSKFVWFEVVPPKPQKTKPPQKRKPINYKNKLDPKTKTKFSRAMDANISETANFILKDLLPKTLSLHSALERVTELSQQLIDDKVALPLQYLASKQLMAVHLRIIRHVSEQFDLTDEERKLMALEYTRPWSQQ
jgi:hypothetical protein